MAETTQTRYVYFFGEGKADAGGDMKRLVGGKGASLADMTTAQLQVPPGFTISAECCDIYFRDGKTWPAGLEDEVWANLTRLEKLTGRLFGQGDNPLLLAVRSGAEQSMPGMMDTVLNVGLHPDCVRTLASRSDAKAAWDAYRHFLTMFGQTVGGIEEGVFNSLIEAYLSEAKQASESELSSQQVELLCLRLRDAYHTRTGRDFPTDPRQMLHLAIEAVFQSWRNDRALAYRQHHDISGLLGTAVTVQMMCPSEVSGVMFTANPVDPAKEQMVIEASFGLGEAIVLGKVTPDRFVLDKSTDQILERTISSKDHVIGSGVGGEQANDASSLADAQISELARLGKRVEAFFQMPCDIEWGLSQGVFYLLQARGIKGLEDAQHIRQIREDTIKLLKEKAGAQPCAWVAHNLAETLPRPTPLTWDIIRRFMSGSGGYGLMYQDLGFLPSKRVKEEGFLDLIGGRIYLNTQRHAELFWSNFPFAYDLDLIKQDPSQAEAMPTKIDPARASFGLLFKMPGLWLKMSRAKKTIEHLKQGFDEQFNESVLPPFLQYVKIKRTEDLSRFEDGALIDELEARFIKVMNEFGKEAVKLSYLGGEAYTQLHARMQQLLPDNLETEAALSAGLDNDKTVEANLKLMEVARGNLPREHFLEEFGHRAGQEFELSQPRWREDPSFVDHMIENLQANLDADPAQLHRKMKQKREEAEKRLPDMLKQRGQGAAMGEIKQLCELVRRYMPYRETAKHYLLMGYELIRSVLLEIDRRKGLDGGVFFLHYHELPELMAGRFFRQEIADRRTLRRGEQRIHVPDAIFWDDLEAIGRPVAPSDEGDTMQGVAVAPGSGTGPATVVFDPSEAKRLSSGYVLVCPSTDPGWTPLFIRAAGLIMERGGVLSHGAVVARDLGIPAVVIPRATQSIQTNEMIRVDGNTGQAQRVRKET